MGTGYWSAGVRGTAGRAGDGKSAFAGSDPAHGPCTPAPGPFDAGKRESQTAASIRTRSRSPRSAPTHPAPGRLARPGRQPPPCSAGTRFPRPGRDR